MKKVFSLHPRSFVLFRTLLGLFLIFYLLQRLMNLSFHYTDQGVISVLQVEKLLGTWTPSLHLLSGQYYFQLLLFLTQLFFALLILKGKYVRISIIISWFLMNSLLFRNPFLNDAGDDILLLSLFWLMFFPQDLLETKFSFKETSNQYYSSPFIGGLILQIFCIYFFSGILKLQSGWLTGESGIQDAFLTQSSGWILQLTQSSPPWVFKILNGMTIAFELIGPLLMLLPFSNRLKNIWVPLMFILFHLLIGSIFGIWRFAITCMLLWVLFISGKKFESSSFHFPNSPLGKFKTTIFSFFIGLLFLTNLHSIGCVPTNFIQLFNPIIFSLQIHQNWNMFTNSLLKVNRDWSYVGIKASGEEIDLTQQHMPELKTQQRWSNYLTQMNYNGGEEHFKSLAKSMCGLGEFNSIKLIRVERLYESQKAIPSFTQAVTEAACP